MKGILCFGDSITFGRGELPNVGWVGRLKNDFETEAHNSTYNLGRPGDTSTDLLKRFDVECASRTQIKRPADKFLIIISIGTNDCKWDGLPEDNKPRTTEENFETNIIELIKKAKSYKAGLMFVGLTPVDEARTLPFEETSFRNERVKLFNEMVKKNCEENNVLFLDLFGSMSKENYPELLEDGLHPNAKGYEFMYNKIKEFIESNKLLLFHPS